LSHETIAFFLQESFCALRLTLPTVYFITNPIKTERTFSACLRRNAPRFPGDLAKKLWGTIFSAQNNLK